MSAIITFDRLRALALQDDPAITEAIAPVLDRLLPATSINTALRRDHFLAQICYESGFFHRLMENLYYTHADRIAAVWPHLADRAAALVAKPEALANAAYADWTDHTGHLHSIGNGPEGNGNGWAFRGRGLIQLTGHANYAKFNRADLPILAQPDLAAVPANAVRLAIAFWEAAGCNEAADHDDVVAVTGKINGAHEGLADRKVLTARAKTIFV